MPSASTIDLVQRAQRGDQEAFCEAIETQRRPVRCIALAASPDTGNRGPRPDDVPGGVAETPPVARPGSLWAGCGGLRAPRVVMPPVVAPSTGPRSAGNTGRGAVSDSPEYRAEEHRPNVDSSRRLRPWTSPSARFCSCTTSRTGPPRKRRSAWKIGGCGPTASEPGPESPFCRADGVAHGMAGARAPRPGICGTHGPTPAFVCCAAFNGYPSGDPTTRGHGRACSERGGLFGVVTALEGASSAGPVRSCREMWTARPKGGRRTGHPQALPTGLPEPFRQRVPRSGGRHRRFARWVSRGRLEWSHPDVECEDGDQTCAVWVDGALEDAPAFMLHLMRGIATAGVKVDQFHPLLTQAPPTMGGEAGHRIGVWLSTLPEEQAEPPERPLLGERVTDFGEFQRLVSEWFAEDPAVKDLVVDCSGGQFLRDPPVAACAGGFDRGHLPGHVGGRPGLSTPWASDRCVWGASPEPGRKRQLLRGCTAQVDR